MIENDTEKMVGLRSLRDLVPPYVLTYKRVVQSW